MNSTRAKFGLLAIATALVVVSAWFLDVAWWAPIAFVWNILLAYVGMRLIAAYQTRQFDRASLGDVDMRSTGTATALLAKHRFLRWYQGPATLYRRMSEALGHASRFDEARAVLRESLRHVPELHRPRLAFLLWSMERETGEAEAADAPGREVYLRLALLHEAPWMLTRDLGNALRERGDLEGADAVFRRGLEATDQTSGGRMVLLTSLARVAAERGLFGAADGWLHEAEQHLPADDPGFRALLQRTQTELATTKRRRGEEIDLVALAQEKK